MSTTDDNRDPGAVSGLLTGVIFVGALAGAIKLADSQIPRPGADADAVRKYWGGSAKAVRFSATGQLISVALLARFTRSVLRLAKRSRSKALEAAALAGGGWAVVSLGNAAVTHARLTGKSKENDELAVKMASRVFVSGGPAAQAGGRRRAGVGGQQHRVSAVLPVGAGRLADPARPLQRVHRQRHRGRETGAEQEEVLSTSHS